jgi:pimeloyl-ACP methyl ester carboxylesterase
MKRDWIRLAAGGAGLLAGGAAVALRRWKRTCLADLDSGSQLVTTDAGVVELARRGSGYPVLVLHGAPGGYDQGLLVGESIFGDGFEVIAPSRPGYLRTPLADNRTPSEQAALFAALLDELDVEQALVVGISAGGPHALHLAAEYPDRVSGVILGSAVTTRHDDRMFGTGNDVADAILTSTPVLDAQSALFALLRRVAPDTLIEQVHGEVSTLDGDAFEEYVEFLQQTPSHRTQSLEFVSTLVPVSARIDGTRNDEYWSRRLPLADYASIGCPVLVVTGAYDASVPAHHAEYVAETVPDVDVVRLDADHLAWIGPDAERGDAAVREFAASVTESVESSNR